MRCLHPVTIKTPEKYLKESIYHRKYVSRTMLVPCGHCIECFKARRLQWVIRMEKELQVSSSCFFLTFTYSEENLPLTSDGLPTLSKDDHQKLMKRIRKEYGEGIRFYMCGEYGENFSRPHMHYVMFNLPYELFLNSKLFTNGNLRSPELESIWGKGFVQIGEISPGGMSYVAKYCQWTDEGVKPLSSSQLKPFSLMSRRPGIGENYLDNGWSSPFMYRDGHKVATPRYYRAKMDLPKYLGSIPADIEDKSPQEILDCFENERNYFKRQKEKKRSTL